MACRGLVLFGGDHLAPPDLALAFAYRRVVYALKHLRLWQAPDDRRDKLPKLMERQMRAQPQYGQAHYARQGAALWQQLHFSFTDRIRYY